MKTNPYRTLASAIAILLLVAAPTLRAADPVKLDFQPADAIHAVLERQVGQVVELRLKAGGDKISGKVEKVGAKLLLLTQLTGAEFSDAVVDLDSVSAIIVRAKAK